MLLCGQTATARDLRQGLNEFQPALPFHSTASMQVLWNICLPTILISLSSIGQALAAHIAFNQESCTPDILPFVEAEVRNALDLVRQTAAWIHPPLYNENIESNIEDLFGSPRPFGESEFDPVNFPRKVFAPDWPDNSYGRGLMGFNTTFVDESELKDEWDLVSVISAVYLLLTRTVETADSRT